jgi:hypothetical protein
VKAKFASPLAGASNSYFENLKCEFCTLQGAKLTFQVQCACGGPALHLKSKELLGWSTGNWEYGQIWGIVESCLKS